MSQCTAAYYDGSSSVCCQLLDGHEGAHRDAADEWNATGPLHERVRCSVWNAAIEAAAEKADDGYDLWHWKIAENIRSLKK